MALITTGTGVPSEIRAGDTTRFSLTYSDYSAAAHTLDFLLTFRDERDVGRSYRATASGTDYALDLSSSETITLAPGAWTWDILLTETSSRDQKRIDGGVLSVAPKPGHVADKSFNEEMVALLESYLRGNLPRGHESWTLRGQSFSRMTMESANDLLNEFRAKVRLERMQDRAKRGLNSGMTGQIRFVQP